MTSQPSFIKKKQTVNIAFIYRAFNISAKQNFNMKHKSVPLKVVKDFSLRYFEEYCKLYGLYQITL